MIWSISCHINAKEIGLWSCGLCQRMLKSWHILRNFRKICGFWAGNTDDLCIYFYFPTCSFQLGPFFLPSWACFLLLRLQSYRNKIKTILAPSVNLQKWHLEYHQNHSRNTVILKLNGSRSKHWNLILKRSNDSLWTKLSGILAFTVMSSIDCIAQTLLYMVVDFTILLSKGIYGNMVLSRPLM